MSIETQTRDESGECKMHSSLVKAFAYAEGNPSVWKISFDPGDGDRVRLVREKGGPWTIRSLMADVQRLLKEDPYVSSDGSID